MLFRNISAVRVDHHSELTYNVVGQITDLLNIKGDGTVRTVNTVLSRVNINKQYSIVYIRMRLLAATRHSEDRNLNPRQAAKKCRPARHTSVNTVIYSRVP